MDIFKYLDEDKANISHRLCETVKNYSIWPGERVFEEAKRDFASAYLHFAKESILESNLKNSMAIERLLSRASELKNEITGELEEIVEMHVDEPEFRQSLEKIADKFKQYTEFCKEQFYPALQKIISTEELKHTREQIEQKVLS